MIESQICDKEMTDFITVHNKCSETPPSTAVHFASRVRISRFVRVIVSTPPPPQFVLYTS
jgi:hypothetical protein